MRSCEQHFDSTGFECVVTAPPLSLCSGGVLAAYNEPVSTVQSAGVPIYYEEVGDGLPVVLVHGFGQSIESWRRSNWVGFLTAHGRRVVGIDPRGHGRSGKPRDPAAYDGHRMADDLITVMDAIGLERTDFMGYSLGGRLAIDLLARFPDRFSSVVIAGVGLSPGRPDSALTAAIAAALETDDVSTITDPAVRLMRQIFEGGPTDPTGNDLKALGAAYRSSGWYDPIDEDSLRRTQVPVLVVIGENDQGLPLARRLIETVPHGELVVLPGEDHMSTPGAQKYKDAVVAFLSLKVQCSGVA
jgi:pimeloyl-ACP methyl ester carboxylesterase